jgi:hypothetical protein
VEVVVSDPAASSYRVGVDGEERLEAGLLP